MNWANVLQDMIAETPVKPADAKTRNDLATDWGVSLTTVDKRLRVLKDKGLITGIEGVEINETTGQRHHVIWYQPTINKKGKK